MSAAGDGRKAVGGPTEGLRQSTKSLRSGPAARGGVSREAGWQADRIRDGATESSVLRIEVL